MMALKRKKTYESQVEKLSGARLTIEQQLMTIEGAHVSLEAMNAMRMGARAMKSIHNHMFVTPSALSPSLCSHEDHRTVEQVDDTMDEIREQMEVAAEINDAISQPLGGELYDEVGLVLPNGTTAHFPPSLNSRINWQSWRRKLYGKLRS
jgi:charged multivesicular body protein 4A/B